MQQYQLPKGYFSVSQMKTMLMCPRKYEYRYVQGVKVDKDSPALRIGKVGHKGFEFFYKGKIKTGENLEPGIVLDYAISELEKEVPTAKKDEEVAVLKNVIPPYVSKVGVHISPVEVEKEVKYISACGVNMLGYIDLMDLSGIYDYKIVKKKWSLPQVQGDLQFVSYAAATGITNVEIHNVCKADCTKGKVEKSEFVDDDRNIRKLRWKYTDADIRHLNAIIEGLAKTITAGIFYPCSPTSWWCSPDWCDYWDMCRK